MNINMKYIDGKQTIVIHEGQYPFRYEPERGFFVDWHSGKGAVTNVWHGPSYAAACREARDFEDAGCRVVDFVSDEEGRA